MVQDDPQTAAVKADTEKRLAKQDLADFIAWSRRISLRRSYSELFFLVLFFALSLRLGASVSASAFIAIMLCITPWLRHTARAPATIVMLLVMLDWSGVLPLAKWAQALITTINQAVI